MNEIRDDLKAIRADVSDIKINVAVNTKSLDAHMARTEINERRLEWLERILMGVVGVAVLGGVVKMFIS